ncbi:armadillo repeat-containing protein 3 [Prorops nasuta]|uniref:armadillo repeat-containing protein 3 n=1 Tax=Prorops nasuta TaxID=863751 RepID=UPI0034CF63D1
MKRKQSQKCVPTGKTRLDRVVQAQEEGFDAVELEIKSPSTAIALLRSDEQPILLAAATALAKYADKSEENLQLLFQLNIIVDLLPLLKHEDLPIRRFAMKLLAEISAVANIQDYLLTAHYDELYFKTILIEDMDTFMQEYASMILCELLKDPLQLAKFIKNCPNIDFAFDGLRSPDPDVKKNYTEIIYSVMSDPAFFENMMLNSKVAIQYVQLVRHIKCLKVLIPSIYVVFFLEIKGMNGWSWTSYIFYVSQNVCLNTFYQAFNIAMIYELLREPYAEIQRIALAVIRLLVSRNKDEHIQEMFRQSRGIEQLFEFLNEEKNLDLHPETIKILKMAIDNFKTMEAFLSINGIVRVLNYYDISPQKKLFPEAYDILARFANSATGRKVLPATKISSSNKSNVVKHQKINPNVLDLSRFFGLSLDRTYCMQMNHHVYYHINLYNFSMLNNRSVSGFAPWEGCIEALFNSHLPIKFAYTARLSFCDVTQNGFYVMRSTVCKLPSLDNFFRFRYCPKDIIYVVNFTTSSNIPEGCETGTCLKTRELKVESIKLTDEEINELLRVRYGRLQPDYHLCRYLDLVRCKLCSMEPAKQNNKSYSCLPGLTNICYIVTRVKMLAKFVARQLCGFDPTSKECLNHQLDIHLKEIQHEFGSSIIPLGFLRVGSYLERALLFKALADRICLPASLVRGQYGRAWIEICVPQSNIFKLQESGDEKSFEAYLQKDESCEDWIPKKLNSVGEKNRSEPVELDGVKENDENAQILLERHMFLPVKLMRPNYIVDLMDSPGELIPLGTRKALSYCGSPSTPVINSK